MPDLWSISKHRPPLRLQSMRPPCWRPANGMTSPPQLTRGWLGAKGWPPASRMLAPILGGSNKQQQLVWSTSPNARLLSRPRIEFLFLHRWLITWSFEGRVWRRFYLRVEKFMKSKIFKRTHQKHLLTGICDLNWMNAEFRGRIQSSTIVVASSVDPSGHNLSMMELDVEVYSNEFLDLWEPSSWASQHPARERAIISKVPIKISLVWLRFVTYIFCAAESAVDKAPLGTRSWRQRDPLSVPITLLALPFNAAKKCGERSVV